jgi:hypothetical protein
VEDAEARQRAKETVEVPGIRSARVRELVGRELVVGEEIRDAQLDRGVDGLGDVESRDEPSEIVAHARLILLGAAARTDAPASPIA